MASNWIHVYVVYRLDNYLESGDFSNRVVTKEVLPTAAEAEREVERLNRLAADGCRYFWQSAKFYRSGRSD